MLGATTGGVRISHLETCCRKMFGWNYVRRAASVPALLIPPAEYGAFIQHAGCTPTVADGFVAHGAGAVARPTFGRRSDPLAVWNPEKPTGRGSWA